MHYKIGAPVTIDTFGDLRLIFIRQTKQCPSVTIGVQYAEQRPPKVLIFCSRASSSCPSLVMRGLCFHIETGRLIGVSTQAGLSLNMVVLLKFVTDHILKDHILKTPSVPSWSPSIEHKHIPVWCVTITGELLCLAGEHTFVR